MRLIYTHPNRLIVENIKNLLENEGIKVQLQNQYAGGGIGELAPIDAWPEVWLERDRDYAWAKGILEQYSANQEESWVCGNCGEENAGSFEVCWNCQKPKLTADS